MTAPSPNAIAILLAAGRSSRMGTCKAALPWADGQSLLAFQIDQLSTAGFQPIVVLGPHNYHLAEDCQVPAVINPHPEQGKTSSILQGLAVVSPLVDTLTVIAVDQPRPADLYRHLLYEHRHHQALLSGPIHNGKLGHPILFSGQLLPQLQRIQDATLGLRQVVQTYRPQLHPIPIPSSLIFWDLNTPDQLQMAQRTFWADHSLHPSGQ